MEAPRFDTKDLTKAAVEVTDAYREEHDTEERVDADSEIAHRALERWVIDNDDFTDCINAIH